MVKDRTKVASGGYEKIVTWTSGSNILRSKQGLTYQKPRSNSICKRYGN